MKNTRTDYHRIVIQESPLIDLRAPVEFSKGSVPNACNLPILEDEERHRVGTCYKQRGQEAAIKLGHSIVSGEKKQGRIEAWTNFILNNPGALIFCSRGGLRSQLAQSWIKEHSDIEIDRLGQGYKGFRNYLIEQLDPTHISSQPILLGGRTGSGKTILLKQLKNHIDLEHIAHHRGSAFGRFLTEQPTQINFENALATAIIKHRKRDYKAIVVEDEGSYIGKRYIPLPLAAFLNSGPIVLLEESIERRIEITYDEYVCKAQEEYQQFYGQDQGVNQWLAAMHRNVERIKKRLGSERFSKVKQVLDQAHTKQGDSGSPEDHKRWVSLLICEYYDPMYDYQLKNNNHPLLFKGDADAVLEYLNTLES